MADNLERFFTTRLEYQARDTEAQRMPDPA